MTNELFETYQLEARANLNDWANEIEDLANQHGDDDLVEVITEDLFDSPVAALLGAISEAQEPR